MLKNGFYNVVALAIRVGISAFTIPIIIRLLGIEEYGLWTLASSIIAMMSLAEAGLSVSTTVFVSKDLARSDRQSAVQTLMLTMSAMFCLATGALILMWGLAAPIAELFPSISLAQKAMMSQALQIGGGIVWAKLLQQVLVGVEQAFQRYDWVNSINTVQLAASYVGIWAIAVLGGKTLAFVQWQAICTAIGLFVHGWIVYRLLGDVNWALRWHPQKMSEILRFSGATWIGTLAATLFVQCDRLIVGAIAGPSALGIYAAITSICSQINLFSGMAVQPLLPALSSAFSSSQFDARALRPQVKKLMQINSAIALGIGATLFILARFLIAIFVPNAPPETTLVLFQVAVVIYSLYSMNAVGYFILLGAGLVKRCTTIQLVSAGFSLLLIGWGGMQVGLLGGILGNAGYLATWLMLILGMQRLNISWKHWTSWLSPILLWFLGVIVVSLIVPDSLLLRGFLLVLELFILVRLILQFPVHKLVHRVMSPHKSKVLK